MTSLKSFEEFECWQLARKIDNELFPLTKVNGFEKDYKLRDQVLGSSGSIMDNIAEGFARKGEQGVCSIPFLFKRICG